MAKHRTRSTGVQGQVAQEYLAGETLHALAKRHDLSCNLVRIWVAKYEAGAFEDNFRAAISGRSTKQRSPHWSAWWGGKPSSSSF